MRSPLWTLVLAAGAGRRLAPITGRVPKQFWRPDGRASLLDDTLARLARLTPAARTVTVVDRSHRPYVEAVARPARLGHVVYQPSDQGTAAGVRLGLLHAGADPDATIVMTPSDHGIARPALFHAGLALAIDDVRRGRSEMVAFGVEADRPERDYGWITPARSEDGRRLASVAAFVEKPEAAMAARLFASGALWNTMVLVTRAGTLADRFRRHLPDLSNVFDIASQLPAAERDAFLDRAYAALPRYDFSRDLLAAVDGLSLVVWPNAMGWSDLGTPDRLAEWQASSGDRRRMARADEIGGARVTVDFEPRLLASAASE
jgi:mannose-1-phosphate guanylyltransferase